MPVPGSNRTEAERLIALETHMEYTVKGIDDIKKLIKDQDKDTESVIEEQAIIKTDIKWMKRIGYTLGGSSGAGVVGLLLDRIFFQ